MKYKKSTIEGHIYILRHEYYFDRLVATAILDHKNKEIRPTQGYFLPHYYGKLNKKIADKLGYVFNNI